MLRCRQKSFPMFLVAPKAVIVVLFRCFDLLIGVTVFFERVEVVYRLVPSSVVDTVRNYTANYAQTWIHQPIASLLNQMCSKHNLQEIYIHIFDSIDEMLLEELHDVLIVWAPGIELVSMRLTKVALFLLFKQLIFSVFITAKNPSYYS